MDRSKVTVAGAAIVEVHHREVVVTANRRTVERLGAPKRRAGARAAAFPPADAASDASTASLVEAAVDDLRVTRE